MMNKELIRYCRGLDAQKVIKSMIESYNGEMYFGTYTIHNECDFDRDAINVKDLTIKTAKFMDTMLEMDDVTRIGNNVLHKHGEDFATWKEQMEHRGFAVNVVREKDNTYNFDGVDLENNLQFAILEISKGNDDVWAYDCDRYVLLEVQCGGDIRSNYSEMVMFRCKDFDYFISGMSIEGDTELDHFDYTYEIERNSEYDESADEWKCCGETVRLYTSANGF